MTTDRKKIWIAMSSLWLDTELDELEIEHIANRIKAFGLSEKEVDDIFEYELAPFLGPNHLTVAGEWAMFDEEWVCEEAAKRTGKRCFWAWLMAKIGITTYAARPAWNKVKKAVFKQKQS
jgi:hypothetical protein